MSIPVIPTFDFDGHKIVEYKEIVRGIVVRSTTIVQGFLGGLKSMVGGKIDAYTEMCEQIRVDAYQLLLEHAKSIGANAIVGFRYDSSDLQESATELLCYGIAVVIEKE